MSDLKIYKEIGSVPSNFGSDSIYAVRTGPGFDLYMTDTTGSMAYKLNNVKGDTGANGSTIIDQNTQQAIKVWTGTQAQYAAIATKDVNTLYVIKP